ncbi:MAG: peptidoglycan-associated lipoprotein Pal [Legionellaceae bacterium]|nr:peptidoglycan-associated lipoprotein Pal [Legionellaceae bacterium]
MRAKYRLAYGLVASSILFLASCSQHMSGASGHETDMEARGLGAFSRFGAQEAGEIYTTKAPHNQTYLFAFDNSGFAPKYQASLMAQAQYLSTHPAARIMLAGHTDARGSREYNIALGERRANTVRDQLRQAGVSTRQIRVVSYGKERPAVDSHDENAYRQNRRVELIYEAN